MISHAESTLIPQQGKLVMFAEACIELQYDTYPYSCILSAILGKGQYL